jgi:hypothetical protein
MRAAIISVILLAIAALGVAADAPKQVTKSSSKQLNVKAEIKAFYLHLVALDPNIRKQVEVLTEKTQEANGGTYLGLGPNAQVVEWFPMESYWDVRTGLSEMTARFLVIQPVGGGGHHREGYDMALVAEFEAVSKATSTKIDPKHEDREPRVLSDELTITFLGFRDPQLSPVVQPK